MILMEYDVEGSLSRRLPSPGKCIYCKTSGVKLTDEHVIPFAIGKDATILEDSCCEVCQRIINPYEQAVLRHQLGHFRAAVDAPTRNKKDRPTSLPLEFVEANEKGQAIRDLGKREIPMAEAPLILNLWKSPPPGILNIPFDPAVAEGQPWRHVESKVADPILKEVAIERGVEHIGFKLRPVNRLHYLRTLAKIAHAFTAAELGVDAFEPYLVDIILSRSDDVAKYVGDLSGVASLEGATGHTFKITLGEVPEDAGIGEGNIAVFMQFWGELNSPPHLVIVGKRLIDMEAHFAAKSEDGEAGI
jgi:hypothetical protein